MGIVVIVFLVILGVLVFIFDIYYLICKLNFYEGISTGDQDKISKIAGCYMLKMRIQNYKKY